MLRRSPIRPVREARGIRPSPQDVTPHRLARLTRLVLGVAVAVIVAAPAAVSSATTRAAPAGGIGLRLVDIPITERDDPRAQLYIVDRLVAGTIIHRRIEVSNTTASAAHIVLYAAGATIANGWFLGAAGHAPNDLPSWTSVYPEASDVPKAGA